MKHSSTPGSYQLSRHVFACVRDDLYVILDLERDEYLALDVSTVHSLSQYVDGWPLLVNPATRHPAKSADEVAGMLRELSSRGLIAVADPVGQARKEQKIRPPEYSLIGHDGPLLSGVRIRHVFAFFSALLHARVILCFRSSGSLLWMSRRWEQRRRAGAASHPIDSFRSHIGAFNRLSPLVLNKTNNCLVESLVLATYLSYFGFVPNCVVGIRARPFTAHCWVQHGTAVLNDSFEYAASLTPILVL